MNFLLAAFKMLSENEDDENSDAQEAPLSTLSLPLAVPSRMQVFLRIRPNTSTITLQSRNDIYIVEDSSTLFVKHYGASDAARRSKLVKSSDNNARKKFIFTKIFDQDTEQSQFFNEAIKPLIVDFFNNQSSTVLSYGTADSGKTHTLFGSTSQPGIIPRSIEFIFSSLNCTLTPWYKPERFCDVINLSEYSQILEINARDKLLSGKLIDKLMCEKAYDMLEKSELNKNQEAFKDSMYSVWISLVEIYNDAVFDLLDVDDEGKNIQLKLAIDKHGSTYIHGMRSVCATTGLEAYEILNAGQTRLSTISASNYKSSRSHAIFTMKLLKYDKDSAPSEVKVSSISFCDLAGNGKIQKLVNNDQQLKESRSINTSLLALGRCMKVIAEGNSRPSTGPFRDSKLTRLIQRSLCGKENVTLLVNVNPNLELLAETQNVLNFASTAMKLTSEISKEDKKIPDTPIPSPKVEEVCLSASLKTIHEQEVDEIILKNKQLLTELEELKSIRLKEEYDIRQELSDSYSKQLQSMEENWKSRMAAFKEEKENFLKFSVSQVESYYMGKLEECSNRKRKRVDRGDNEPQIDLEKLEKDNFDFSLTPLSYKKSLEILKNENKRLKTDKNRQAFELSLLKKNIMKLAELTDNAYEKVHNDFDFENSEENNTKISFDKDVMSRLSVIHEFIKRSFELKHSFEDLKKIKSTISKEVQCDSECSIINEFYKEIQELLEPDLIELPEIDDSLELVENIPNRNAHNGILTNLIPRIKNLFNDNILKVSKLELENADQLNQIQLLNNKIEQQKRDILQASTQYRESESARLSLLTQNEDLKKKLKSETFFKNYDSVTVNSEESKTNKLDDKIISMQRLTPRHSLESDFQSSSFESDSDKIDTSATRSSSNSSRNDSGLASSIESGVCKITDEKCCQINSCYDEDRNQSVQERLVQLKFDYEQMKAQHLQEALRVTELSQELEHIREAMNQLKDTTSTKDRVIIDYQSKLSTNEVEIERLNNEKHQLEIKCDELVKDFQQATTGYENKLTESQLKLKVHEEGENRTAKYLEDYLEKSVNLKIELAIAHADLEKTSSTCKEYALKIEKLEKELIEREFTENMLEEKITAYERDLAGTNDFSGKVNEFEKLIDRIQREKADLHKLLNERLESQSIVEKQLENLGTKIDERDDQILSLKSELAAIIRSNLSNSRKAKELGKEVTKLLGNVSTMKEAIGQTEEARKDLEQSSDKEICNLRARLTIFEENAELLNVIYDTNETKQDEIDKLKAQVLEKDKELEFFKKNRSATIQRYECLVRQLQDALKMNNHSSRLKKLFPNKQKYIFNDLKESLTCNVHGSEPQIRDWKLFNDESDYLLPCSSMQTVAYSSSAESSGMTAIKDEPDRLITDVSEKSLETRKKACSKIYHSSCKELSLLNNYEAPLEMDTFGSDHYTIINTDGHTNVHLQHRKSFK